MRQSAFTFKQVKCIIARRSTATISRATGLIYFSPPHRLLLVNNSERENGIGSAGEKTRAQRGSLHTFCPKGVQEVSAEERAYISRYL